ncbi:formyltetrahydrofolate deformylase [Flavobacterium sp. RHBU_3]|uniref:formyltetrahydrofolate deformylase n=1 Tax=Flavobacterium sp. RHBU_3 TaxID=3391184 RepID=UPI0039847F3A
MVLLIQCTDRKGLVATIANVLAEYSLNITTLREFVDQDSNQFFARFVCEGSADYTAIKTDLTIALPQDASITINPNPDKKVAVLVTKEYHCLSDILVRNHFGTLGASVECVIGNHPDLEDLCNRFSIPFHFVSHEEKNKETFEQEIISTLNSYTFDYIILAKFMRILSPAFVATYPMQVINIHHSFLPAFIGAHPYRKAFERGVKLIGATAHFVTDSLDEGPIIAQETISVNHTFTPADMVKAGKEIEKSVLAKAVQLILQDRVFVYGNKTVVFE